MKIVEHAQGTPEWLAWRRSGLGGSDIPAVMGICPYRTPLQLWEEKCGFREGAKTNRAMQHGHDHEPICRREMEAHLGAEFPPICIQHDEHAWMLASLDGYCDGTLLEIKCPLSEKSLTQSVTKEHINPSWVAQIHWQMIVGDIPRAFLGMYDWRSEEVTIREIQPPTDERRREIIETAKKFWENVRSGIPPELEMGDYETCYDTVLTEWLDVYADLVNKKKKIESELADVRAWIINSVKDIGHNVRCGEYTISRMTPRKSYDIESMRVNGIDVDKYLKPLNGQESYTIRLPKEQ